MSYTSDFTAYTPNGFGRENQVRVKRIESYIEKAKTAEVLYCEDHDREYYDFEFEGKCPICFEEDLWSKAEHGDEQARQVLEKSGRLEDIEL